MDEKGGGRKGILAEGERKTYWVGGDSLTPRRIIMPNFYHLKTRWRIMMLSF